MKIYQYILLPLVLLSSCSSGGISGSGSTASAGITSGTIEGVGSLRVNGQAFDTASATITVDGAPGVESDLRVGQLVDVRADLDTLVAASVTYRSEIKGPVTSVDVLDPALGVGTLVVLGQTVRVDAQTIFDGTTLSLVAPGDLVEVSGPRDASSAVVASYLERKSTLDEYKVVGRVASVDLGARTFQLSGLIVDYVTADIGDMPANQTSWDALLVEVKAAPADFNPATTALMASKVEPASQLEADTGSSVELEGFVTGFVSPAEFDVLGFPVRTTANTVFENGTSASLANNVKVEVKGVIASDGVLEATRCEIESTGAVRCEGMIEALDTSASTLMLLGVTWEVRSETELEDDSDAEMEPLTLADLGVGDFVGVRGYLDGATPVASRLERDDPDEKARLRGPVTSVAAIGAFELELLGVVVRADGATVYRDEEDSSISREAFFDRIALGTFVDAKWDPFVSTASPVDELSLEDD